jgi:dipeptidyl aminopeptidase/acylaminoacyl peptidase
MELRIAPSITDFTAVTQGEVGQAVTRFLGTAYAAGPEIWREASPLTRVSDRSAPMLFLHGTADTTAPYLQSVMMHDALQKAGVASEIYAAEVLQ